MRPTWLALAVAMSLATAGAAQAPRTTIGVLTCTLVKSTAEQPENLNCGFKSAGSATEEKYTGAASGLAQSALGKQVLIWTVMGPSTVKVSQGFLAQRYAKKQEGGEPSWVGEKNSDLVLQLETHGGAEAGASVVQIELKLTGTSA